MSKSPGFKRLGMVRRTALQTRITTALFGVFLTLVAGLLALQRPGKNLVSLSYDLPFLIHRAGASGDVTIVYLDTLDGEFFDRKPQARLLDEFGKAGARAVVYDVIFDRPSEDPSIDREFAAAMLRFRGVDENGAPIPGATRRSIFLACGRETFNFHGASGETLIPPTDVLLAAADNFGVVAYDDDTFTARKLTTGTIDEPSLTWQAATALGADLPDSSRLDPRWINYAGPPVDPDERTDDPDDQKAARAFLSLKASSVRDGTDPEFFRDKIVVVGGNPDIVGEALGQDLFTTPFHRLQPGGKLPYMSGVEIQANMLENLRQGNWLTRASTGANRLLVILAGLLLGTALAVFRPTWAVGTALLCAAVLAGLGVWAMHSAETWFAWTVPAFLQTPVALLWGLGANFYFERYRRGRLGEAFSKVVSPAMLDRLGREDYQLELGGEKTKAALMFTDLENYTNMSEDVGNPVRILRHLNQYFEATTGHIFDEQGSVIQYVGDAIYAAWGAPAPVEDGPNRAVRAAWKLSQSAKFDIKGRKSGHQLRTRIGLHFGEVVAGLAGTREHMAYSVLGDATNLAARLEGLNKLFGTRILLSKALYDLLDGAFHTRRIGQICVKGKADATTIYELVGPAEDGPAPDWIADYHLALDALESNDLILATKRFEALIAKRAPEGDGPSSFFLEHLDSVKSIRDGIVHLNVK